MNKLNWTKIQFTFIQVCFHLWSSEIRLTILGTNVFNKSIQRVRSNHSWGMKTKFVPCNCSKNDTSMPKPGTKANNSTFSLPSTNKDTRFPVTMHRYITVNPLLSNNIINLFHEFFIKCLNIRDPNLYIFVPSFCLVSEDCITGSTSTFTRCGANKGCP